MKTHEKIIDFYLYCKYLLIINVNDCVNWEPIPMFYFAWTWVDQAAGDVVMTCGQCTMRVDILAARFFDRGRISL